MIRRWTRRFCMRAVPLALVLGLGGCFTAERPLIGEAEAVFPFQRITFVHLNEAGEEGEEAERVTLLRRGDTYVDANPERKERYLFAAVSDGLYIGEVSGEGDDGVPERLFGIVRLDDETRMTILSPMCDDAPDAALAAAGIRKVEKKYVDECVVEALDQLKALAGQLADADVERQEFRILELVR